MIVDPFETKTIVFYDWDDTLIGELVLPAVIKDARRYVNHFVNSNLIHPDLQIFYDPWFVRRGELMARADRDWPNRKHYTREAWWFESDTAGRLHLRHSIQRLPCEYVPSKALRKSYRPAKEGGRDGQ